MERRTSPVEPDCTECGREANAVWRNFHLQLMHVKESLSLYFYDETISEEMPFLMKSFFNLRHTRYTAIAMVFVWLMTLGIGVANACLIDVAQNPLAPAMQVQAHHHAEADEHALASGKAVCLAVCAAEKAAAVKFKPLDTALDSQAVPVARRPALTVALLDLNDRFVPLAPDTWDGPPVSIRFVRLTI